MEESWLAQFKNAEIWCVYLSLAAIAMWEAVAPRRALSAPLRRRWIGNIGLFLTNMVLARLAGPIAGVALAFELQRSGWGFFNLVEPPLWIALVGSFLFLDFCFYVKHRIAHVVPWFWRFHRVHHSDSDLDITTSLRFHPLDVAYQIVLFLLAILIIGAPPVAVAAYALVFAVVARFQHGNVYLPEYIDRLLRLFVVSADMHRIHHSARQCETDSNYGGVLPWHDRLLGTYVAVPLGGQQNMRVGLDEFRQSKHMTLGWMLVNPLLSTDADSHVVQGSDTLVQAPAAGIQQEYRKQEYRTPT